MNMNNEDNVTLLTQIFETQQKIAERLIVIEQQLNDEATEAKSYVMLDALRPLVKIADAYDENALDDEARKFWGKDLENKNEKDPSDVVLYSGRGGKTLLTLRDCIYARTIYDTISKL